MGKKNKKKKFKYTKVEFQNIICPQCGLCGLGTVPEFCYNEVYIEDPKKFIREVFKNLLEVKRWVVSIGNIPPSFLSDDDIEHIFKTGFCSSNYCKQKTGKNDVCEYLSGCLSVFRRQIKSSSNNTPVIAKYRKETKKERKINKAVKNSAKNANARYVPHPYPTFFCSKNMEEEVRRIVDGPYSEQQDTGEESVRCDTCPNCKQITNQQS